MKVDSYHVSKSNLKIFQASHGASQVRLECGSPGSGVIHVFDESQRLSIRCTLETLLCFAETMRQWDAETNPKSDPGPLRIE